MKRTYLWSLLAFMMVAMLSVGFVSCSDDDDDGDEISVGNLPGMWVLTRTDKVEDGEKSSDTYDDDSHYMIVYEDGTAELEPFYLFDGLGWAGGEYTAKWTVSGNKLTLKRSEYTFIMTIKKLTANQFVVVYSDGYDYTKTYTFTKVKYDE